ncbi:MAG: EI24 domain-containing protein [Rhodopirellula sp.]|nr:EI24 domain-containing protein [Rhodopirellula sp.]
MDQTNERQLRQKPRFVPDYVEGISTAADGFRFLCRYPSLWQYGVWALLTNIAVAFASLLLTFWVGTTVWKSFVAELPIAWWASIVEWIGLIAILLLAFGIGLICYMLLQSVFCAWAFSKLAYRVELFLGASSDELSEISYSGQILDALRAAGKLLLIDVALLFLNVIPFVGTVAALAIGYYMHAWILGAEFLGYPQELRGVRWKQRQQFAKTWRPSTLGLGTIVAGLMLIPIVGAMFQTTAVVGAVLLNRRINGLPDSPADDHEA